MDYSATYFGYMTRFFIGVILVGWGYEGYAYPPLFNVGVLYPTLKRYKRSSF